MMAFETGVWSLLPTPTRLPCARKTVRTEKVLTAELEHHFGASPEKIGASPEKIGASPEKIGASPEKIGASPEKIGASRQQSLILNTIFTAPPASSDQLSMLTLRP
jgi:hypothetical protein